MYQIYCNPENISLAKSPNGFQPPKGVEVFHPNIGKVSLCFSVNARSVRKLHSYTKKEIRGVLYRVHSSYEGGPNFKELYEKCLATRILKLYERGCAKDAAGD